VNLRFTVAPPPCMAIASTADSGPVGSLLDDRNDTLAPSLEHRTPIVEAQGVRGISLAGDLPLRGLWRVRAV
jgi:hypothetical protein